MLKYDVQISKTAEDDIQEIYDYIALVSNNRAISFIEELENQINKLEKIPERCPVILESQEIGVELRHLIYGNYRTIFQIENQKVYILRIINCARLLNLEMFTNL